MVGISDVCPQNNLYHDHCDVIITSRMAVSKMVDNDNVTVVEIYGSGFLPQPFILKLFNTQDIRDFLPKAGAVT